MNFPTQPQAVAAFSRWWRMPKTNALPRPVGATVLSLLAIALAALVLPASGLAAPPGGEGEGEGGAPPAQLSFQPGSYDFGTQWVYQGSEAGFQLTNAGEAPVQLGGLDIVGPDSNVFWTGSNDCWNGPGGWIEPGQSCWVQVYFQPQDTVSYEASLRATVNGEAFTAALSGRGGRAVVEADANPFDFGAETVGASGPVRTITLTNSGDLPGAFFIAVIAGGDAGSFQLVDENCSGEPVPPAASCVAHVRFRPQGSGPKVARLALFGNDEGGTMIALTGEGVAAAATLAPGTFDFGEEAAGGRGPAHAFAVRNEGSAPLELGAVALVGADPDQFALAGDDCTGTLLAAGEECLLRVRFAPDSAGAKAATLRVGSAAGAFTSSLGGRGTPAHEAVAAAGEAPAHEAAAAVGETRSHPRVRHHRFHRRFRRGRTISALPHRRSRHGHGRGRRHG